MKVVSMLKSYLVTTTHQKVLDFFANHPGQSFYGAELSRENKLSMGAVNKALRDFEKENILEKTRRGNVDLYTLKDNTPLIQQLKILSTLLKLESLIEELKPLAHKIILYGSSSQGVNDQQSDIDLLIVTTNADKPEAEDKVFYFQKQSLKDAKLQAIIKTTLEWAQLEEKNPVYFQEVLKGMILWDRAKSYDAN